MTIQKFSEIYGDTYETLYNSQIPYDLAVDGFESRIKTDKKFQKKAQELCEYRHDFLSSDRELAAFFLAYGAILQEENFKRINNLP